MVRRYVVVYEIIPEGIALVRVVHGSQDLKAEFPQ